MRNDSLKSTVLSRVPIGWTLFDVIGCRCGSSTYESFGRIGFCVETNDWTMSNACAEFNAEVDVGFWRCEVKYSCIRYGRPFETSAHVKTDKRAGQRLPQILYGPKASCLREPFCPIRRDGHFIRSLNFSVPLFYRGGQNSTNSTETSWQCH
jgi:hypothetical protein